MIRLLIAGTLIIDTLLMGLAQADIIPIDLISIFIQLPIIGLFAWYVLKKDKDTREWIDHLMEEQEKRFNRTIDLFEKILDRQDDRQREMTRELGKNSEQMTINTATVNESIRLAELVEQLKDLIEKWNGKKS